MNDLMTNEEQYTRWYKECDAVCMDFIGLGIDDLPDGNSRDAFDAGETPDEYVRGKLEEEGYPLDDE
jgi:hypothetical protein